MARKNRTPEENARREKIRELLQMTSIGSMDDIQNLFKETIAEFMENGLEAELDEELGYSRYDCNGVQREHNKKLNNGLPILHKVPPKRDYGRSKGGLCSRR